MPKTIIITESTDNGVDKKLLSELIKYKISDSFLNSVKFKPSLDIFRVQKSLETGLQEKEFRNGEVPIIDFDGTIDVEEGDVIVLQARVTDANFKLAGDNVFDNPVSASINFEKISELEIWIN